MNRQDVDKVILTLRNEAIKQAGVECGVNGRFDLLMNDDWLENYIAEYECTTKNELRVMRTLGYLNRGENPYIIPIVHIDKVQEAIDWVMEAIPGTIELQINKHK
jgi:hypothetical protein